MDRHTPGPWKVNDHDHDEQCLYIESDHDGIATVFTDDGDTDGLNMDRANANLVAAAPELLDALRALLDETAYADGEGVIYFCNSEAAGPARAAIAKAEGRS